MTPEEKTVLEKLEDYSEYLYQLYRVVNDPDDANVKYDMFRVVDDAVDLIKDLIAKRDKVVRCRDCTYGIPIKDGHGNDAIQCVLSVNGMYYAPDWYCADGEER